VPHSVAKAPSPIAWLCLGRLLGTEPQRGTFFIRVSAWSDRLTPVMWLCRRPIWGSPATANAVGLLHGGTGLGSYHVTLTGVGELPGDPRKASADVLSEVSEFREARVMFLAYRASFFVGAFAQRPKAWQGAICSGPALKPAYISERGVSGGRGRQSIPVQAANSWVTGPLRPAPSLPLAPLRGRRRHSERRCRDRPSGRAIPTASRP
jgi:hypothetical protein